MASGILKSVVSLLPDWPGYGPGSNTEGKKGKPKNPEGTAVAVLPGGYLATNVHVIGRATTINIRLNDGRIMPAEIIGRDPSTDIALIKTPVDFPVPEFGPAPALGDKVCAIGNQFGLGLSVTCGVASALHRTGTGFNPIEDFIQTDAVVNPGGSGGAMIDAKGRLIGLVSAIFTKDSDANIGVNFASSLKLVMRVANDLKEFGRVQRGKPGFKVRDLSLDERLTTSGAAITFIVPEGAADSAGLQPGDVITAIGERKIYRATDVPSAAHMARPGEELKIGFLRNGKQESASLKLSP
ncbi:MAG: trypsin-like peptidase domain-containing protein [Proteobacteria bacterium]|nr:trypsin-like peptidase domain-containing protein [Pseudomonadota bacterium]MDA1022253.1 trypsin-like peptidase domain-containing protein [Pseudomonadota bacterium]